MISTQLEHNAQQVRTTGPCPHRTLWVLRGAPLPNQEAHSFPLSAFPFTLGRSRTSDIIINSPVVSSHHCEFLENGGLLFLRDNGSTNGTFVNGKRITHDTLIAEGDLIEIGETFFRILTAKADSPQQKTEPVVGKTACFELNDDSRGPLSLQMLLRDGNLLPCFQAIHCLKTGSTRGYEFLARSAYPGIESAGRLFDQARRSGQEVELSLLCREQALNFGEALELDVPVFLNTHPAEALLDTVVPQMRRLRDRYPNRSIVLEIHEAAITEPALIRELRAMLAQVDVRLAFDDFGRGQARIRELICAPSDYIKFDAALIQDLQGISREQFRFFRSIIAGIRAEGAVTVAEGVENDAMAEVCREVGFDLVQGYLFSRPTLLTVKA